MIEERRKDYQDLPEIKIQLAILIERLDNLLASNLPRRVNALETYKANLFGVCIGATAAGGFLGFLITISTKLIGSH